jgi:hypothetical protein
MALIDFRNYGSGARRSLETFLAKGKASDEFSQVEDPDVSSFLRNQSSLAAQSLCHLGGNVHPRFCSDCVIMCAIRLSVFGW